MLTIPPASWAMIAPAFDVCKPSLDVKQIEVGISYANVPRPYNNQNRISRLFVQGTDEGLPASDFPN